MRYATLATLLALGVFGMSASVAAEDMGAITAKRTISVDITGPASFNNAGTIITVAASMGVSNFTYEFHFIRVAGGVDQANLYKGPYVGTGGAINKSIGIGSLNLQDSDELRIELSVRTSTDNGYDEVTIPVD